MRVRVRAKVEVEVKVKAGERRLFVSFVNKCSSLNKLKSFGILIYLESNLIKY